MTTHQSEAEAAIRKALEAGPTPGPWLQRHDEQGDGMYRTQVYDPAGEAVTALAWHPVPFPGGERTDRAENAAFIAACNPAAITELLDSISALRQELAEARKDAERLDFMQANPLMVRRSHGYLGDVDCWTALDDYGHLGDFETMREAADAAMKPRSTAA